MVEIKGRFKVTDIKEVGGKKLMTLSNSDKDQNDEYINTYYKVWCTEKVSNMVSIELKRKIEKATLVVDGWLKVSVSESNGKKYTNLTIFPRSIEEYTRS